MIVSHSLEIDAPIGQVFALVSEPDQIERWMRGLQETVYPGKRSRAVGTRFTQRVSKGGRVVDYEGEITAYEKPTRFSVRMGRAQVAFDIDYRLTDLGGRTRLEYTATTPAEVGMARPAETIFRYLSTRVARKQMRRLKNAAEEE